jgi:LysM repeat protein
MNSANPFQIPSCFQKVDENRRRERFKKGVIATIAAAVLLLVGLLIQGCKSERASAATPPQAGSVVIVQTPKSLSPVPQSTSAVASPMPIASKTSMTPTTLTTPHSATVSVYVVKSGDTLSRIAKAHGISIKILKSVNGLDGDRIAVGVKLKIPTA